MENINENKIKLSGTLNIPKELETNITLDLKINNVDCLDYRLVNKQDGTYDRVYNVKVSELSQVELITSKESIKAEKKKSVSKRIRGRAYIWCQENDMTDPETFYQTIGNKIINNFDEIVEFLKHK